MKNKSKDSNFAVYVVTNDGEHLLSFVTANSEEDATKIVLDRVRTEKSVWFYSAEGITGKDTYQPPTTIDRIIEI